ncbi:tubby-like F-box protein 2 [Medicago truncatula]|uniref:Tubby-F-box-like protein n=1 Tax=Medicago truncatula TaxID=3880 RepID=G7LES4_MEDTR|nr:tubby-like F-box protein 2 [Medicago truncatula]AET03927.1 tubby-F-box-like protein [Medicago truncatula]
MSLKIIVCKLKGMKNRLGSISKSVETKHRLCRTKSHVALDVTPIEPVQQGQWAYLPPELLLDIIRRVEESATSWPARAIVVCCASVCKSWRSITLEIVKTPQQCGMLTFPISLKQPGPSDYRIQCFIRRNKRTSTFLLYLGLEPSKNESNKLLLAAKKIRSDFVISLATDDFCQASNKYVGKVRFDFAGIDFTIYDSQPPHDAAVQPNCRPSGMFNSKPVSPRRVQACSHLVSTISYKFFWKSPRRMYCIMNSNIVTTIQEGGNTTSPTLLPKIFDEPFSPSPELLGLSQGSIQPLLLKSKDYMRDEQRKCWCLDYMGRAKENAIVLSTKNFQLVEDVVDPSHNASPVERERVVLQLGKIGKDIFIMDYSYPLSAFQAFAICLTQMRV